jgi:hypothetical protein
LLLLPLSPQGADLSVLTGRPIAFAAKSGMDKTGYMLFATRLKAAGANLVPLGKA